MIEMHNILYPCLIDNNTYFTLTILQSCKIMLSIGKVVVFSRYVETFSKNYGTFSQRFLGEKNFKSVSAI